jgi:signal transduction histidine kinase
VITTKRDPNRSISESLESLHWLYSVEQRSVVPIKWLVLFLAVTLILIEDRELLFEAEIVAILGTYILTNILFTLLFVFRYLPVHRFRLASYASLAADLGLVSSLILFTGGLRSDFYFLFILLILRSAALFQDPKKKFMTDLGMTFVYLACVFYTLTDTKEEDFVVVLVFRITLIWGVMLMSWFLLQVLTSQQARIFAINERLRYQMEQNREVLSSMADAVMVFSPSLELRLCNPSAERLLSKVLGVANAYTSSEVEAFQRKHQWDRPPVVFGGKETHTWQGIGIRDAFWSDLTPDQIADPIERVLEEVRFKPDRRIYGQPLTLTEKTGVKRSLIASAAELGKGTEGRLGWMLLLRDISEFRSLEAQLISSEKLAAVGTMAAGLAHELGNPLGIIKSCANYLLKKTPEEAPHREELSVLSSEAERCERILRQLLTFASQDQLRLNEVDLRETLQKAINLVTYQATEKVRISLETEHEKLPSRTDENLLTQALVNLLLNAVESIENEGEVRVSLAETGPRERRIVVRDSGKGMGKETLARLFEPFYTTKPTGTGLGLSITQRIVQRLGGTISVRSEPGKGAKFTIDLPRDSEKALEGEAL